uniref:Uncharacterized protein n=1 Tax=Sphaerodactylus townsendi TaxID=933632 RepID=A0ACB8EC76_9SAUR
MWATAPLAGNVSLAGRPLEGANSSEAEALRLLQGSEKAWDSEREEYRRVLRKREWDIENLQAALTQAQQVAPAAPVNAHMLQYGRQYLNDFEPMSGSSPSSMPACPASSKHRILLEENARCRLNLCLYCSGEGHIAASCPAKCTPTTATSTPVAKPAKSSKPPLKGGAS